MKKIRRKNGTEVLVDDDYLLQNGESMSIPLSMLDSAPRMVTDSRGNPAGQRPGFLYIDSSDVGHAIKETAHAEYREGISQRWRSDRWSKPVERRSTGSVLANTANTGSDVEAAYAEYNRTIAGRWK